MCLYSLQNKAFISEEDITCYKVVRYRGGKYYAPFVMRRIPCRYLKGRCLYSAHGEPDIRLFGTPKWLDAPVYRVGNGFIHTYGNIHEAFQNSGVNKMVFECVIPKGTEYWKDMDTSELASKVIRFVRKIKPNQLKK